MNKILLEELSILRDMGTINKYYAWLKANPEKVDLYRIGRAFEYATMRKLRSCGWYCVRKFGSKGFEDVAAMRFKQFALIQCKYSRYQNTSPEKFDLKGLIALAKRYGAEAVFAGVANRHLYFMSYKDGGWKTWNPNG